MTISVLIPCYNQAHLVGRAIESAQAQTLPPLEILVVDDGSKDNCREVVEGYAASGSVPVRYLQKPNGGVSSARNHGVREARGEWIAFVDSDDWWKPSKLAVQAEALRRQPEAVLSCTGVVLATPDEEYTESPLDPAVPAWPTMRELNFVATSSAVVKTSAMRNAGYFNESLKTCEDWDMWVRIGLNRPFAIVPDTLAYYFVLPTSLSNSNAERLLADMETILEPTLLQGLSGAERSRTRRRIRANQYLSAAITMRDRQPADALGYALRSLVQWPGRVGGNSRLRFLLVTLLRLLKLR